MVEELWSRYGELTEIWFDGGSLPVAQGGPDLVPILNRLQPNAVVFQGPDEARNLIRWVGNERGVAPYPCWNTADGTTSDDGMTENVYAGNPAGKRWVPGECDVPVRKAEWFWRPGGEKDLNSADEIMEMYYNSVGRNCNLILNANPGPDGLVPQEDMSRYEAFGRELKRRFANPLAETSGTGNVSVLSFASPVKADHAVVMENIARGERVRKYEIDGVLPDGSSVKLCAGESVGHKRIERFAPVEIRELRFRVLESIAEPDIRSFAAYCAG